MNHDEVSNKKAYLRDDGGGVLGVVELPDGAEDEGGRGVGPDLPHVLHGGLVAQRCGRLVVQVPHLATLALPCSVAAPQDGRSYHSHSNKNLYFM